MEPWGGGGGGGGGGGRVPRSITTTSLHETCTWSFTLRRTDVPGGTFLHLMQNRFQQNRTEPTRKPEQTGTCFSLSTVIKTGWQLSCTIPFRCNLSIGEPLNQCNFQCSFPFDSAIFYPQTILNSHLLLYSSQLAHQAPALFVKQRHICLSYNPQSHFPTPFACLLILCVGVDLRGVRKSLTSPHAKSSSNSISPK